MQAFGFGQQNLGVQQQPTAFGVQQQNAAFSSFGNQAGGFQQVGQPQQQNMVQGNQPFQQQQQVGAGMQQPPSAQPAKIQDDQVVQSSRKLLEELKKFRQQPFKSVIPQVADFSRIREQIRRRSSYKYISEQSIDLQPMRESVQGRLSEFPYIAKAEKEDLADVIIRLQLVEKKIDRLLSNCRGGAQIGSQSSQQAVGQQKADPEANGRLIRVSTVAQSSKGGATAQYSYVIK